MRCRDCSQVRGYPYKQSHLVALRPTKITASDPTFDMVAGGAIAEVFRAKKRIPSIDLSWRFVEMTRDEAVFQWGFSVAIAPHPKLGWRAVMPARQNREMKRFKAIEKELRGKYSLSND